MALVDSLLSAIVRADGDALVMHVGERPYVVVGTQTINISTHGLNLDAMTGMLTQLLPADAHTQLEEFGAVEHRLTSPSEDRFTVVAARGGDDIWIEIRRRRPQPAAAAPPVPVEAPKAPEVSVPVQEPVVPPAPIPEPMIAAEIAQPEVVAPPVESIEPEPVVIEPEPVVIEPEPVVINAQLEPVVVASAETQVLTDFLNEPEPVINYAPPPEPTPAPELEVIEWPTAEEVAAQLPEPVAEPVPAPIAEVIPPIAEPEPEPIAEVTVPVLQEIPEPVAEVAEPAIPEPTLEELLEEIPAPVAQQPEAVIEPMPEQAVEPVVEPVIEPIAEPVIEPIAEPVLEPIAEVILEPVAEAITEPIAEVIPEPIAEVMPEPIAEVIPEPIAEVIPEPIAEVIPEPIAEVIPEPIAEVIPEPIAEVIPEPIAEAIPEPIAEVIPEPIAEVIPEPIAEVIPEPIAEVVPEPIAEVILEPIAEAIPEPIAEVVPEPIAEVIPEPIAEVIPEPIAEVLPEPIAEVIPEPIAEAIPEPIAEVIPQPIAEVIPEPIAEAIPDPVVEAIPEPVREPAPQKIAASIEREAASEAAPANVLPMTRTVRIEVPPRATAAASRASTDIERLLRIAAARGASALFLTSDSRPWIRMEGDLRQLESEPAFARADVERAVMEIAPESGHESIGKGEATEWIAEFADVGRIRCTTFTDHHGPGMLLRMIATRAATAEQLGLAREVQALATEPQGVVLVAGPRGSGKSTLLSALVDLVNRQRAEFVITLERQIRLVHDNRSALVSQREIRGGADDSVAAARSALREGPDVLVVDDLVSTQMVPLLLTAASEGLLIFVSITAPSTADAVQRFVELAPPEMRKGVQTAMAESFRGAVAQVLLKKAGGGLVATREVLLATAPVTRVIAEGQLTQLTLALESGRKHGMVSFTDALADNVSSGVVDVREAFRKAPDRNRLLEQLKRDGVDTSVVERLA